LAKEPESRTEATRPCSLADVRALARIASQFDLSEVELERGGERIRIRRERNGAGGGAGSERGDNGHASRRVQDEPAGARDGGPPADAAGPAGLLISSPFVGTFFRSPSPDADPFVKEGQSVRKGQTLCIVEAMKLMNEIEAEVDCKILEILVKNGDPVEFGQSLFRVLASVR